MAWPFYLNQIFKEENGILLDKLAWMYRVRNGNHTYTHERTRGSIHEQDDDHQLPGTVIGLALLDNDKSVLPLVANELENTCINIVEFIALEDGKPEEIEAGQFLVSSSPEVPPVMYGGCDDGKGLENGVVRVEFDKFEFVEEDSVLALK